MASPRQRAANQLNALRATGPRTQQGKRRSAVNATRHGLTVPVLSSWWGTRLPDLHALLCADGLDAHQAHGLAMCILDFERNLQHQRNRYLHSMGLPGSGIDPAAAGHQQRQMAQAIQAQMPARGSPIAGVSRSAAQSAARFLLKIGQRKQRNAEQELRNADRHLRRAAHALVRQCRSV
jgi:hypothetical protein